MQSFIFLVLAVFMATVTVISGATVAKSIIPNVGEVTFKETPFGVRVKGEFRNLQPGPYSIYINVWGDVDIKGCIETGPIYEPFQKSWEFTGAASLPAVDIKTSYGFVTAMNVPLTRNITWDRFDSYLQLEGPFAILGRSVVLRHGLPSLKKGEKVDTFVVQPEGTYIGCGTIYWTSGV